MSKRVDISLNLKEIETLLNSLDAVQHDQTSRLYEVLTEIHDQLEDDEHYASSIREDKDGYESYTESAKEGLKERYTPEQD